MLKFFKNNLNSTMGFLHLKFFRNISKQTRMLVYACITFVTLIIIVYLFVRYIPLLQPIKEPVERVVDVIKPFNYNLPPPPKSVLFQHPENIAPVLDRYISLLDVTKLAMLSYSGVLFVKCSPVLISNWYLLQLDYAVNIELLKLDQIMDYIRVINDSLDYNALAINNEANLDFLHARQLERHIHRLEWQVNNHLDAIENLNQRIENLVNFNQHAQADLISKGLVITGIVIVSAFLFSAVCNISIRIPA